MTFLYTTFTDRATGDWAEIWGDRTSSLYTNRYGKGWLLVNIVGYFMVQSSFSLFYYYYLLICHQSALERAFLQNCRSILGLTAHKNCFTLRWPGIIMLKGNCAVVSGHNDNNRWKQREKKDCSKHKGLLSWKLSLFKTFYIAISNP